MKLLFLTALAYLGTAYAHAAPALDALKAKLQKSLGPEMKIQSVAPTPVPGLYELKLGKAILYSDPNCKHCRELEHTLSKADNLTIYTFPFPILKPDSLDKAKAIWCAPNRSA